MPFAPSLVESAPMLAVGNGTLLVFGFVALGVLLMVYSIYWMIFKMGKD